ncbi:hypothetical protein Tco_0411600 [Tanacetum coccineum]
MNPISTQQAALDNALVPPEKRLNIKRCNARIAFSKPQREETYQVTLEALKLSPCYPAFQITAEICPRILNQYFIASPLEEELVTLIQELGYSSKCNMLSAIYTDQIHQPWRTFAAIINRINLYTICDDTLLGTLKFVSKTQDYQQYRALIPDDMINQDIKDSQVYKTYYDFATRKFLPQKQGSIRKSLHPKENCVVVRDTPGVSVSNKKAPAKGDRSKDDGTDFESGVPDEQQLKTSGTDEGTGTIPGVPDVPKYQYESDDKSWGDSEDDNDDDFSKGDNDVANNDDDDGNDAHDSERTDLGDDDENPSFTLKDNDEEEHDEEYKYDDDNENAFEEEDDDDLYKDVDVRSLGTEHKKERQGDEEMTDADQNVSQ